jgi:hypothetical protein
MKEVGAGIPSRRRKQVCRAYGAQILLCSRTQPFGLG